MKTTRLLTPLFLLAGSLTVGYAQSEYDDMYFTGKDRAKREVKKEEVYAYSSDYSKKKKSANQQYVNPTDSYSARNLNPEYVARSNAKSGQSSEDYFVSNYQYINPVNNNLNSFNNSFNSWYGNSWYNAGYFSPYINSWNSPYYNPYYDPFYSSYRNPNPWADPYYRSGWSSSFSYYWGSSWNYGWGGNIGYTFGNPYYNNAWCPSYGYGGYGYYSPTVIVVTDSYSANYGKRSTRSSATTNQHATTSRTRSNNVYVNDGGKGSYTGGRTTSTGRTVSTSPSPTRQAAYYNRSWRTQTQNNTSERSVFSNPGTSRSIYSGDSSAPSRSSGSYNSGGNSSRSSGSFNTGGSSSGASRSSSSGASRSSSSSSGSRSSRGNN